MCASAYACSRKTAALPWRLRAKPILGREFIAVDERPGAPSVTLLSYEVWQGRYGGDPSIVGHGVRVNGVPSTVIGVMSPGFAFPMTAQLWQPITAINGLSETNRRTRNLNLFGRLADGVSLEQARSELETIAAQIAQDHPDTNKDLKVMLDTLKKGATGGRQAAVILATFMGAVAFVLLIACANVASLLLARSARRAQRRNLTGLTSRPTRRPGCSSAPPACLRASRSDSCRRGICHGPT